MGKLKIFEKEAFGITRRLLKRDFSGNAGMAVKNSIYQFSTNLVAKFGSLIFIYLILMRVLSEELFGLYSLALSTILVFAGFCDLGIGTALIRYASKYQKNSKGYVEYLAKLKFLLTITVSLVLFFSAYFIANYYYQKPLFLALLAGIFYIIFLNLSAFLSSLFQSKNDFKTPFHKEILFQISRIVLIGLALFLTASSSSRIILFTLFLCLGFSYLIISTFLLFKIPKYVGKKISSSKKMGIRSFIFPLSVTAFAGVFFGQIDTIMLGRFVAPEFIAHYQAAFYLVVAVLGLISFSAVLFPIFAKLKKSRLKLGLKKSLIATIPLSILAIIGIWVLAPYIFNFVNFVTGRDYSNSVFLLRILSLVLFTDPLLGIFSGYWGAQGKTKKIAFAVVISTALNILLNYLLITWALAITGEMYPAVIGAGIATIISRFAYLGLLVFGGKDNHNK